MAEEIIQDNMIDQEEGEILEDGEIADDEEIVSIGNHTPNIDTTIKDEKENKESNQSKFSSFSSFYPVDRDDHFKIHNKRKKKNNSKKRKRSNSNELKRKAPGDHNLVDISAYLNDSSFDTVEMSDEDDYKFELVPFDVLLEILGCTAEKELIENVSPSDKQRLMLRIVKIMKKQHGQDPDTSRRFARLKRRTRERPNSNINPGTKSIYKAICKFYLEGKCHKGSECYFSHDCVVPKRKELCKFYLQGFCGKGDDCLFMHGEFPCKFFHTNTECYSGVNCRFSHAPLTEETREILRNYLDSGTLPDDPKPFRSHYSDWSNNKNVNEPNEHESPDFDSSFNYETEQLLLQSRPVLLGDPTQKMKISYETWNWQQELKELEKAYTGLKKNLFCIDEVFAITEQPPIPRIEDDEEEVEAQIMNYYNDMLDTDEMDEMVAIQEIEEHQRKMESEKETSKEKNSLVKENEISEEEKRLIEASAHDEDLRVLPGLPNAFSNSPVISSVFDQPSYNPPATTNFFPNNDNYTQSNSFNDGSNSALTENKSEALPNYNNEFGNQLSSELTASDVTNMVRQIRNGVTQPPSAIAAAPIKPEYRDPRLNRIKDPRTTSSTLSNNAQTTFTSMVEEKLINKPFIKICNPNVIIEYKLTVIKISSINYSSYYEYYHSDNILKNDPRLKKFFSTPTTDQKSTIDSIYTVPKNKIEPESLMPLPSLNVTSIKKLSPIVSPTLPTSILSPELTSKTKNDTDTTKSFNISRDPRIRSKELENRRNSDSKVDEQSNELPLLEVKPELTETETKFITKKDVLTVNPNSFCEKTVENISKSSLQDIPAIPSYAIAALPSTISLYSSFSNFTSTDLSQSQNLNNSNDKIFSNVSGSNILSDDEDRDLDSDALLVDEGDNTLKVDLDQTDFENKSKESSSVIDSWNLNIATNAINSIDSDNEMEIDLQHHESEVDSENENELIIVSSSETEDNKDCDNPNNDPMTISDYNPVNC